MIDELEVINYALIRRANIEFSPGFTVLTGETGTGKTALVGAIKLLIGERADAGSISDGTDELRVSARLIDAAGDETVVSRRVARGGRSRAGINDEMASATALAERIGPQFDLLGQHEHQSLLSASSQLAYLDSFGGAELAEALHEYQTAWRARQTAADELAALEAASTQSSRSLEEARFTLDSIQAVAPFEGEYEQLTDDLPILRSGEDLATSSNLAWELLRGDSQALDLVAQATRALSSVNGIDARLDSLAERLDSAQIDLEDIAAELLAYRDSVSFDAQALQDTLDRLGQLEGLMRRFGPHMQGVFARRNQAQHELDLSSNLPERLEAASRELESCEQQLVGAALALGNLRSAAAAELAERLTARLDELAFSGAAIETSCENLDRRSWTSLYTQRFELMFRPGLRSTPRPLARIASGGELSRVMLALKSELIADDRQTLVFDEVDAGIGGVAANAVADYLRRLADTYQVIVVTHLAQVAALADRHYVVEKTTAGDSANSDSTSAFTATVIREVTAEDRVVEIARMLSGSSDVTALAHARELLGQGGMV